MCIWRGTGESGVAGVGGGFGGRERKGEGEAAAVLGDEEDLQTKRCRSADFNFWGTETREIEEIIWGGLLEKAAVFGEKFRPREQICNRQLPQREGSAIV